MGLDWQQLWRRWLRTGRLRSLRYCTRVFVVNIPGDPFPIDLVRVIIREDRIETHIVPKSNRVNRAFFVFRSRFFSARRCIGSAHVRTSKAMFEAVADTVVW